jgi:hypothetical protein
MRRPVRPVTRFLLALALVARLGVPATAADNTQPVSGFLVSAATSNTAVGSLTAAVSPFGLAQGTLSFTSLDPATGAFTASFVLANRNGSVSGAVSGQFISQTQYLETITFTGGTGAYAGATGGAALIGVTDPVTHVGVDVVLTGSVSFP